MHFFFLLGGLNILGFLRLPIMTVSVRTYTKYPETRWHVSKASLKPLRMPYKRSFRMIAACLYGMDRIAAYMGCSGRTIGEWTRKHSFPCAKIPNGTWATSTALIDLWLLSRSPYISQKLQ